MSLGQGDKYKSRLCAVLVILLISDSNLWICPDGSIFATAVGAKEFQPQYDLRYRKKAYEESGIPWLIYGTAWKKENTSNLVKLAFSNGFSSFDTANFPKHYSESGVGVALQELFAAGVKREDIFIQTKFTPDACEGQPSELHPYDSNASVATQVRQSFQGSLEHLGVSYIDSYILHAAYSSHEMTLEAYREMERLKKEGVIRFLGVSNFNILQLKTLEKETQVPITFVQNRCLHKYDWDASVRNFCDEKGIIYQGYWLLTGNRLFLRTDEIESMAIKRNKTVEQILIEFLYRELGVVVLDGTKSEIHMKEDLDVSRWHLLLSDEELKTLRNLLPSKYDESAEMKAYFQNQLEEDVELFWKNPKDGSLVRQGIIKSGKELYINTFHSHRFVAKSRVSSDILLQWTADRARDGESIVVTIGSNSHSEL